LCSPDKHAQGTTWATYETLKERMLRARHAPPAPSRTGRRVSFCSDLAPAALSHRIHRGLPPDGELPPMQTVSYPLDVVRRRMQTAVLAPGLRTAPGTLAVFAELLRTEGVAGMYKGLSVNYFKGETYRRTTAKTSKHTTSHWLCFWLAAPIAMGISFSLYARVKQALEGVDGRQRTRAAAKRAQDDAAAAPPGRAKRGVRARQPADATAAAGARAGKQQVAASRGRH